MRLDWTTFRVLPAVWRAFRGGDDHLLSGVARIFQGLGFRIVGAHEVAPEILMPRGNIGTVGPGPRDVADIARGLALLRAVGPFDVGQAVVVADNQVLAVEAVDGTDNMLERIAELRERGRVATAKGVGVLIKAPKPTQDRRLDMPAIGPKTVEAAARAGLAGIAVVAGSTIIAEPQRCRPCGGCREAVRLRHRRIAMTGERRPMTVHLVAGEESGDALGGALMDALRARNPGIAVRRARRACDGGAGDREPVRHSRTVDHRLWRRSRGSSRASCGGSGKPPTR